MSPELFEELKQITPEEQLLLSARSQSNQAIDMSNSANMIDEKKLKASGALVSLQKHTRFAHYPKHTHHYVEGIYMCSGHTCHQISDTTVELCKGDFIFINPSASHEILPAETSDIAIHFAILPQFFMQGLSDIAEDENPLRDFLTQCLCNPEANSKYLIFHVENNRFIENLVENLLLTTSGHQIASPASTRLTMGLLFLSLIEQCEQITFYSTRKEDSLLFSVYHFIEKHYNDKELTDLSEELSCDFNWLSKEIKKRTGQTYTDLVQTKRLAQSAFLLRATAMPVGEIAAAIGYDNMSYFHRIFQKKYGLTPRHYRLSASAEDAKNA